MKIVTWNVNSIAMRSAQLQELILIYSLDVILLQETKCQNEFFPKDLFSDEYNIFLNGQKSYNGVAVLVKKNIDSKLSTYKFCDHSEIESRYAEVIIDNKILIASVYVPNGQEVGSEKFNGKLKFIDNLRKHLLEQKKKYKVVVAGDFNVAPYDVDVRSPERRRGAVGFNIQEQIQIRRFFDDGFYDPLRLLNQDSIYSWWDYRSGGFQRDDGMRIDYFLISPDLARDVENVLHCKDFRAKEKPSDHIPIILSLDDSFLFKSNL